MNSNFKTFLKTWQRSCGAQVGALWVGLLTLAECIAKERFPVKVVQMLFLEAPPTAYPEEKLLLLWHLLREASIYFMAILQNLRFLLPIRFLQNFQPAPLALTSGCYLLLIVFWTDCRHRSGLLITVARMIITVCNWGENKQRRHPAAAAGPAIRPSLDTGQWSHQHQLHWRQISDTQ